MENYVQKWNKVLDIIKDNIGTERFNTFFKRAEFLGYSEEENRLTVSVPSHYFYERYEDTFFNIISSAMRNVFGPSVRLSYEIRTIAADNKSVITIPGSKNSHLLQNKLYNSYQKDHGQKSGEEIDSQLNPALNFDNYCVGESNRLPVTIAKYIAKNPGKAEFNPFFLYGNVGVGKTHLIQAIGIHIKEQNPNAKVLFTTIRQFQNLYANATLNKQIPSFINWYQQLDVILFDDLQELSNKTGTAEALFPIFNHLRNNRKNLIFTCDRPPIDLDGMTDRLIDRFKWGVTEQLPKPDFNLKKKILHFKAVKNGLELPEDVIDFIAQSATESIRELEGIVMGLLTRSISLNAPITLQLAQDVLKHTVKPSTKKVLNFDMILEVTSEHYNLNPDAIFSASRMRDISDARQVIMYLVHKHTQLSSPAIGHKLNRKHTTVLHGINSIKDRLPYSKELTEAVNAIETELFKS